MAYICWQSPFSESGMTGNKWLKLLMNRDKDQLSIIPAGKYFARIFGFNKERLHNSYKLLGEINDIKILQDL